MFDKIKTLLGTAKDIVDRFTDVIDLSGGVWLALFTGSIIWRVVHGPALGASEAAVYASAVGAYAASNIGAPRPPGQA
jgi:hypothetical protein